MKKRNIYKITLFLALFFLLFPPLQAGWQQCTDINDAELPLGSKDSLMMKNGYNSNVFVTTDSGENWSNITIGITSSFYGSTINGSESSDNSADYKNNTIYNSSDPISSGSALSKELLEEPLNNIGLTNRNSNGFNSVEVISYLVKITKYVKYNILNTDGKRSVKVSKEKLTEGLYNLKYSGSDLVKSFYFYRLETDKGTITKQGFC